MYALVWRIAAPGDCAANGGAGENSRMLIDRAFVKEVLVIYIGQLLILDECVFL